MFGRLRTKDGHLISSRKIRRINDKSRNNYCVAVSIYLYKLIYYINSNIFT